MTHSKLGLLLVCVAATALTGPAFAQTTKKAAPAAASAAGPAPLPAGPAIPGICIFDKRGVIGGSVVGKFVGSRLSQLQAQAEAELTAEQKAIQTDATALEAQKATTPPDQFEQKVAAINARGAALQRKAQLRQREFEATEQKAFGRVLQEAEPILRQSYIQRNCSVLLGAEAVIVASPSFDLTGSVIQGLDAKITQFQFDREHLDQQAAAPAG